MVEINQGFAGNQNQQANQNFQSQAKQSFNQAPNQAFNQPPGLFHIPEKFLQLIPWIPIGLEMLTGQKIPATGILADILQGIQQVQFGLSQVQVTQQQLLSRLTSLESHASSQLNNLSQQLTNANQDFRLIATEAKRSLEFHANQPLDKPFSPPRPELENE